MRQPSKHRQIQKLPACSSIFMNDLTENPKCPLDLNNVYPLRPCLTCADAHSEALPARPRDHGHHFLMCAANVYSAMAGTEQLGSGVVTDSAGSRESW